MKLSKNATQAEFEESDTATRYGIPNKMNATQLQKAVELCENVFQPLRDHVGIPVVISSGFRSVAVNKKIGGSSSSQHCKGEAMDIKIDKKAFVFIKNTLDFDQLIYEFGTDERPQWVHVSYREGNNRKQVLRAIKTGGKTHYTPY
jgi:zinc D-Ala-D-Ala carboxypeptidase